MIIIAIIIWFIIMLLALASCAQELHRITITSNSVVIEYDSTVISTGLKVETTIKKVCENFPGESICKSDTITTRSPINKVFTNNYKKTLLKPVTIITLASALLTTITINGQEFHASKYGFSWYYDTSNNSGSGGGELPPIGPQYGALWATYSEAQAITTSNTFDWSEIRTQTVFTNWNGVNSPITERYFDAGKKVVLNVHPFHQNTSLPPGSDTNRYSSVDLTTWRSNVRKLVNSISEPENVVMSSLNEENNSSYAIIIDSNDLEGYVNMTSILAREAAARGIKVSNGGLQSNQLVYATYRYLSDIGSPDTVNFLRYCIPIQYQNGLKNRNTQFIEDYISDIKYLLRRYDTIPAAYLPYLSLHLYYPFVVHMVDTAGNWSSDYTGLEQILDMINYFCPNRQFICNELGFMLVNQALVDAATFELRTKGFKHVTYWNWPDGTETISPVASTPTTITTLGQMIIDNVNP